MATKRTLKDPWLIAVWPGMGNVALTAGTYLVEQLGATPVGEISSPDLFEIQSVEVKSGVAEPARLPRNVFFEWKHPEGKQDLLIFVGEAQPSTGGFTLCKKLLDFAEKQGVKQFFTFAAMATQLHPRTDPRVFAVATQKEALERVEEFGAEVLEDGQISGLNGVLLAAGAERGLSGVCLLGEMPYFAVGVPNPKASKAVLEIFTSVADVELDFTQISQQAEAADEFLVELLERLQEAGHQGESDEEFSVPEFTGDDPEQGSDVSELDRPARQRIEKLFKEAEKDRSKAFQLKQELDRLGTFKEYEDRFLDLFKKAE